MNFEIYFLVFQILVPHSLSTYYYCKGFRVPENLTEKRHIDKVTLKIIGFFFIYT